MPEEERYIGGDGIECRKMDDVVMFDVLGREQVCYDGRMLRKEMSYYDGESSRYVQVESGDEGCEEMSSRRGNTLLHFVGMMEDGVCICVLNYGLRMVRRDGD